VTVGPHGTLTPDEARGEAKRLLGQVAAGLDPAAVRQEGKGRRPLGTLLDQFLVDHAEAKLKASTAGEYRRLARLYVPATLRRRVVAEVRPLTAAAICARSASSAAISRLKVRVGM
jgi:hypothetical protein